LMYPFLNLNNHSGTLSIMHPVVELTFRQHIEVPPEIV
uniref:SET domain-containing protein n=1 Tax=Brugia timori TaxID=42155 RepID=A0A0R3RDJ5_9BILA